VVTRRSAGSLHRASLRRSADLGTHRGSRSWRLVGANRSTRDQHSKVRAGLIHPRIVGGQRHRQDGDSRERKVPAKWLDHPNLQRRPHAPNKGRGRLQRQIRRAFVGHCLLSSSQVYDWAYPRHRAWRRPMSEAVRWSVHRILRQIADPICKVPPHNAWL
jgi:hypothetical protein